MRTAKRKTAALGLICAVLAMAATAKAAVYTYNFDSLNASDPTSSSPVLMGTTTIGAAGQDNWVWTSSTANVNGAIVRNDSRPGFSGNWSAAYLGTTNAQFDAIMSRKNDANWSYSIGSATQIVISAKLLLGASANAGEINHRAEVALGYDTNNDGTIRGTAATADNSEWGFMFGYDSSGPGWYGRPAALGTAVTANTPASGVWLAEEVVNLAANSGDGSGTLMIQQLYDAAGNPVTDTLHAASASLTNLNLGIKRMSTVTGGSAAAANPANWNGIVTRYSGNGGIDDLTITVPEPGSLALGALIGATFVRRHRRAGTR